MGTTLWSLPTLSIAPGGGLTWPLRPVCGLQAPPPQTLQGDLMGEIEDRQTRPSVCTTRRRIEEVANVNVNNLGEQITANIQLRGLHRGTCGFQARDPRASPHPVGQAGPSASTLLLDLACDPPLRIRGRG